MSTNLTEVLGKLLQDAISPETNKQFITPDSTYVSLTFDNPELKKIMPWAGTHKGPQSVLEAFAGMQSLWKTLDLKVTDTIEQGELVAYFGTFTYKSNTAGKEITSPFNLPSSPMRDSKVPDRQRMPCANLARRVPLDSQDFCVFSEMAKRISACFRDPSD